MNVLGISLSTLTSFGMISKFRQVFIGFSEVVRIIEDLENGIVEPTSARLGTEDVTLDIYVPDCDSSSEGCVDGAEKED